MTDLVSMEFGTVPEFVTDAVKWPSGIKHFKADEFRCKCCRRLFVRGKLLVTLERLRTIYGHPIRVLSGYRCEAHNKAVGGSRGSFHMRGAAADLHAPMSSDRWVLVAGATALGCRGVGVYEEFVHVDIRDGTPVLWTD